MNPASSSGVPQVPPSQRQVSSSPAVRSQIPTAPPRKARILNIVDPSTGRVVIPHEDSSLSSIGGREGPSFNWVWSTATTGSLEESQKLKVKAEFFNKVSAESESSSTPSTRTASASEASPLEVEEDSTLRPALSTPSTEIPLSGTGQSRFYSNLKIDTIQFHRTTGKTVKRVNFGFGAIFQCSSSILLESESNPEPHGYVFTRRSIELNESIFLAILITKGESACTDFKLDFGLTSCDPGSISQSELPEDPDFLMDRPEYWTVVKDIPLLFSQQEQQQQEAQERTEFCFTRKNSGEVLVSQNGGAAKTVMHADSSIPLWAFFRIGGSQGVTARLLGTSMNQNLSISTEEKEEENHAKSEDIKLESPVQAAQVQAECMICCETEVDCVFVPCGHVSTCYNCGLKCKAAYENLGTFECPICRSRCTSVMKIYMP